jgi:tetratricopeptide (TPR) repeat protein
MNKAFSYHQFFCWVLTLSFFVLQESVAQSVLTEFKDHKQQADEAYRGGNYAKAVALYEEIFNRKSSTEVNLRIARSYYYSGKYDLAVRWFGKFTASYSELTTSDLYLLAEAYAAQGKYDAAINSYSKILTQEPDNMLVAKKIWRLRNLQYLYEDSLHYSVEALNVNSESSDVAPIVTHDGLIFASNRAQHAIVSIRDANTNQSFYKLYYASPLKDSLGMETGSYDKPQLLEKTFGSRYQEGAVAIFNHGKNMVYTTSAEKPGASGRRPLQLYFAEKREESWYPLNSFQYNNNDYTLSDPAIQEDGRVLYFVSDMKGGQGGKDIYRSEFKDGKWSRPVNLADLNTPYDEATLFLHRDRTLYFSSTGHAGMGGRDIFKADILANGFGEVTNLGYPINTHFDDFSFSLDSLGFLGYFSSNRMNDASDDLYRVDIDMQPYPLAIEGVISFKEINSVVVEALPHARLILIDNFKNVSVSESFSDSLGNFVLEIPYFSQYKLKVIDEHNNENVVSLEVPRHRKKEEKHDIVVVRDAFKNKP